MIRRRRRPPEVVLAEVEARVAARFEARLRHKDRVISAERARGRALAARADHWQRLYRDLAAGLVNDLDARDLALAADTGLPSAVGDRSAASGESQACAQGSVGPGAPHPSAAAVGAWLYGEGRA